MPSGGARNRSGPSMDPNSGRSDSRGIVLTALPAEGNKADAPPFPLGKSAADDLTGLRELQIWYDAWTTPQACAWVREQWRWQVIAEYCRLKALVELSPASTAALIAQLHRYRDQIGLTPAGLKENGWKIAADETAEKRAEKAAPPSKSARQRMNVVRDGTEG
jgi:hypothetical protein